MLLFKLPLNQLMKNFKTETLGRAGKVREALAQFEEALRLNPAHEEARQNAARARRMLGGN